ncbi:MAG TPA: HNH endonuclease [Pirellulales bacterium]
MAGFPFLQLVDKFVDQLERSAATVIRLPNDGSKRLARLRAVTGNATTDCLLFLWTITPGGGGAGVRPANERRIQVTNVANFPLEPGTRTLIGGWSEEFDVWCFWDVRRHTRFSHRSPSWQVTSETLEMASQVGIATYLRSSAQGQEVVVSVNADSLLWYVERGEPIHNSEADSVGVSLFADSGPDIPVEEREFIDESTSEDQAARRFELVTTMRAYRDAKFTPEVLRAYRYKCAVCQCALKLVDAAHIVPVSYPDSTDEITNGLALCRLHHGAYDTGLMGIQSTYRIVTNPAYGNRLSTLQLDMGLEEFKSRLPETITVPSAIEVRPDSKKLAQGLRVRNWPDNFCA